MISAAENSGFGRKNSVEDAGTLGPTAQATLVIMNLKIALITVRVQSRLQ